MSRSWLIVQLEKFTIPRTILAKLAFDAGVPLQIIAASYGVVETVKKS
jgi:hypothetical protein